MTRRTQGTPTNPNTYAERLRWAMDRAGYGGVGGQTSLAKTVGVSSQSINQAVTGSAKSLSAQAHCRVCQLLQINPVWLADGVDQPDDTSAFGLEVTNTTAVPLTDEELRMLRQMRTLPAAMQSALRALVTTAAASLRPLAAVD